MRDKDGVFVGVHVCGHWQGVERYEDRECCGGRRYRAAVCRCDLKGVVVDVEGTCCAKCSDRDEAGRDRDFSMMAGLGV
jgi:hypothetical protein